MELRKTTTEYNFGKVHFVVFFLCPIGLVLCETTSRVGYKGRQRFEASYSIYTLSSILFCTFKKPNFKKYFYNIPDKLKWSLCRGFPISLGKIDPYKLKFHWIDN